MKRLSIFFGLIFLSGLIIAQTPNNYHVLKVVGNVHCTRLNKSLETGDKITDKDILKFENSSAYLTVMGPQGRKLVRNTPQSNGSELKSLLTDIVSLEKKHTASRGHDEDTKQAKSIKKLKTNLSSDTILILGSGKANFGSLDLLMNDTAIVEVRYRSRHENIYRKISKGAMVDLSKESLFIPDQQPVKIQLVYYPNRENIFDHAPETIGSFIPMYEDDVKIKSEVTIIISTMDARMKDPIVAEIKKYFTDEYWPVLDENLLTWLSESNLLKP